MKSILIGNGVNIQFGGGAYTSGAIIQRIKSKAKQGKYKELFEDSISGDEIANIFDGFVRICNEILSGIYDNLLINKEDKVVLSEFKKRYKNMVVSESKDIMLEDWFFLFYVYFLKYPELIDNRKGAVQSLERLVLDGIFNDGKIQEIYKFMNEKFKQYLLSFDNIFTLNYDDNIDSLISRKIFHLHGDFSVLADG